MAMLKTITPKSVTSVAAVRSTKDLSSYLTGDSARTQNTSKLNAMSRYLAFGKSGTQDRIVMHDHSDNVLSDDVREWVREFIAVKEAYHKLEGIPYYHFIISPDPKDKVSAEECMSLARDWAERCYPGSQWFVAIHDDNANHITHAHLIMNSVYPMTGKKIHRTKQLVAREARVLQELCVEHELTPMMDNEERKKLIREFGEEFAHIHDISSERAERALIARGGKSYKAKIRVAIDESAHKAHSWNEFVAYLDTQGITVKRTRKGITYVLADWEGKGARRMPSDKLGNAYTEDGVLDRLGVRFDSILGTKTYPYGYPTRRTRRAYILAAAMVTFKPSRPRSRHRLPNGMVHYESLSELYLTRIASNPVRRRMQDVVTTINVITRGGYSSAEQLKAHADSVADSLAESDLQLDELKATDRRLSKMLDIMVGMDARKAELRKLEVKRIWNVTERANRRELRQSIESDEQWVNQQLDEAYLWAESVGRDTSGSPTLLVAEMMKDTRRELGRVNELSVKQHAELEELLVATRVISTLDGPARPLIAGRAATPSAKEGGGAPMREGMRLPDEKRSRYSQEDWSRLAATIGEQIDDSRAIADATALLHQDERRRREESDAWLRSHGIEPATSRPISIVDSGRGFDSSELSGRARRSGDESPQQ